MENHFDKQAREWDRRSYHVKMVSYLNPGGQLFIAELEPDHGFFHSSNIGVTHMGFHHDEMVQYFKEANLVNVQTTLAAKTTRTGHDGVEREFNVFITWGVAVKK
ncbi:MAG: hypothetical protein PHN30_05440 [Bacteroidales bacterium]|nr:hypothetical protein [Bacteroidales bacterium]